MSRTFGPYNPYLHNADSGGFSAISQAYKNTPSIALYVDMRRKYPKVSDVWVGFTSKAFYADIWR